MKYLYTTWVERRGNRLRLKLKVVWIRPFVAMMSSNSQLKKRWNHMKMASFSADFYGGTSVALSCWRNKREANLDSVGGCYGCLFSGCKWTWVFFFEIHEVFFVVGGVQSLFLPDVMDRYFLLFSTGSLKTWGKNGLIQTNIRKQEESTYVSGSGNRW